MASAGAVQAVVKNDRGGLRPGVGCEVMLEEKEEQDEVSIGVVL